MSQLSQFDSPKLEEVLSKLYKRYDRSIVHDVVVHMLAREWSIPDDCSVADLMKIMHGLCKKHTAGRFRQRRIREVSTEHMPITETVKPDFTVIELKDICSKLGFEDEAEELTAFILGERSRLDIRRERGTAAEWRIMRHAAKVLDAIRSNSTT